MTHFERLALWALLAIIKAIMAQRTPRIVPWPALELERARDEIERHLPNDER
jgi:hypothetical protein